MIRLRAHSRIWLLAMVAIVALAAPAAWYLGSPLFINTVVDESLPTTALPIRSAPVGAQAAGTQDGPSRVPMREPAASQQAGPMVLARGEFGVVDAVHKGEGSATVLDLGDGRRVLRLEDFRVTNGPDLFVYLSGHPAPRSGGELHEGATFEVARLKGNVGNQNYELPGNLDLALLRSAVIYCKRFSVVFSTAELTAG